MNLLDLIILLAAIGYALGGFRNGAVVGVFSLVGFFGGAVVGAQLAHPLGSRLADGRAQVPIAIVCVLRARHPRASCSASWVGARHAQDAPGRRTRPACSTR